MTVTSAMVDAVAATTAGIRNLGRAEGGHEDNLRFVHHHVIYVATLLRQARFNAPGGRWANSCSKGKGS